jgi:hypothetical protein
MAMSEEPKPRETTRVWVTLTPVLGGIVISADNKPIVIPADLPLARIVLDIPHGVGLGPEGPMHVKVGAPND